MRKHAFVSAFLLLLVPLSLLSIDVADSPSYIKKFKDIAIREMSRSGIPASITLAQAIHESAWGNGQLALQSNNYFGIKCKDYWTGPTYYIEDDDYEGKKLIKSCFRAYKNIENSFEDHSDFLRDNPRYKILFQYNASDYRSWAKGLQKCGYATDKKYAEKLIRTIEKYQLYQYDSLIKPFPIEIASTPSPVVGAPRFNIGTYTNTNVVSPRPTTVPQPIPIIKEENYNIPTAFILPDDYQRGTNRSEDSAPLFLSESNLPIVEQAEPSNVAQSENPAIIYQEEVIEIEQQIEAESKPQAAHPISYPQQEAIIRMTYAENNKAAQLSRKPRVTSSRRR